MRRELVILELERIILPRLRCEGHCELAGDGIEYDLGKMKQNFRRKNRYEAGKFHTRILQSMSRAMLPSFPPRAEFARKARAYFAARTGRA